MLGGKQRLEKGISERRSDGEKVRFTCRITEEKF
jgi:hypothetical protein